MTVSFVEATAAARRIQARSYRFEPTFDVLADADLLAGFVLAGQDCDGSSDCAAAVHVHGCFADDGKCDEPNEHGLAGDTERLREALERIAFGFDGDEFQDTADAFDEQRVIARAALAEGGV